MVKSAGRWYHSLVFLNEEVIDIRQGVVRPSLESLRHKNNGKIERGATDIPLVLSGSGFIDGFTEVKWTYGGLDSGQPVTGTASDEGRKYTISPFGIEGSAEVGIDVTFTITNKKDVDNPEVEPNFEDQEVVSDPFEIDDTTAPPMVEDFMVTETEGLIILSWNSLSASDVVDFGEYEIERAFGDNPEEGSYTQVEGIGTITIDSFSDQDLNIPFGTYSYRIRAVDTEGNRSEWSMESVTIDANNLSAVWNNEMIGFGDNFVSLSWSGPDNVPEEANVFCSFLFGSNEVSKDEEFQIPTLTDEVNYENGLPAQCNNDAIRCEDIPSCLVKTSQGFIASEGSEDFNNNTWKHESIPNDTTWHYRILTVYRQYSSPIDDILIAQAISDTLQRTPKDKDDPQGAFTVNDPEISDIENSDSTSIVLSGRFDQTDQDELVEFKLYEDDDLIATCMINNGVNSACKREGREYSFNFTLSRRNPPTDLNFKVSIVDNDGRESISRAIPVMVM